MGEETRAAARAMEMVERKDRVLIVEDEDNARKGYEQLLQRWGCDVVGVGTAEEALAKFASYKPDTLIADVELPGMNGLDLLKQLGQELTDVPAVIITGKGSEERAVAAIEAGAFWYIEKPLKGPVLHALLDRALSKARDARQLAVLQRQLRESGRLGDLVGGSKPMQDVMRIVEMAAPSSASVLITGETPARVGRPQSAAAREQSGDAGGRACTCSDEQRSRAGRFERAVAAGFVLSAERISCDASAAARSQGRYSATRRIHSARHQRQTRKERARSRRGSDGHFHEPHLAGKHSRTAQRAGAVRDYVREGFDFTLELAGRIRQNDRQKHERPRRRKIPDWDDRGSDGARIDSADACGDEQ